MTKRDPEIIRFNVLRNALYHTARRRSLERVNRVFNFGVVILGTAAFGDVFGRYALDPHWIGAAVAILGALQLVFDFGRQARDHQALQRDYYALLADIEDAEGSSDGQLNEWYSRMIRITADEPPVLRGVDAKAYNDAIGAMEMPKDERLLIPLWQKPFIGVLAFEGHDYPKICEVRPIEQ